MNIEERYFEILVENTYDDEFEFDDEIVLDFFIVREENKAKILVSFLDNTDYLFWLSTVWANSLDLLNEKIENKINSYLREELKDILNVISSFEDFDKNDKENLVNLVSRSFIS